MLPSPFARGRGMAILARALAGTLPLSGLPGPQDPSTSEDEGRIVRFESPEQIETALDALARSALTGNDVFFVRSHFPTPAINPLDWRLAVSGLVRAPLTLTLDELGALPHAEATHTLECAGNGRAFYRRPAPTEAQWELGAVGTARWSGVRLADVLHRAEVRPEARHVWLETADRPLDPGAPRFLRSIPLEKAMDDVLLVDTMNGEPLPAAHGAPLRAIVPGWFGMASAKWLVGLRVESEPSSNHFHAHAYRYVYPGHAMAPPVDSMRVKSLITSPRAGARVRPGVLQVEGFAWAGVEGVRKVEVSVDGARGWQPATLLEEFDGIAWRPWRAEVLVTRPGHVTLLARATDRTGASQPLEARPNASGYANNSIQRVPLDVIA